jgi:hypothetical protein
MGRTASRGALILRGHQNRISSSWSKRPGECPGDGYVHDDKCRVGPRLGKGLFVMEIVRRFFRVRKPAVVTQERGWHGYDLVHYLCLAAMSLVALSISATGAPRALAQNTHAKAILEAHGLIGRWATDCGRQKTNNEPDYAYRAQDGHLYWEVVGEAQTFSYEIVAVKELSSSQIQIKQASASANSKQDTYVLEVIGNRQRALRWETDGRLLVANGKRVKNNSESPWLSKCGQ